MQVLEVPKAVPSPKRRTQKERSSAMVQRLLDATVETLVEKGYAGTSTTEICKRAEVSRGAQVHHFPTKAQLMAAAVDHLVQQRLQRFARFVSERASLDEIFEALWDTYTGPTLVAWIELVVAARTDAHVHAALTEVNERLVAFAEQLVVAFVGPGRVSAERASTAVRFIFSTLDGLTLSQMLKRDEAIARRVLADLRRTVETWLGELPAVENHS